MPARDRQRDIERKLCVGVAALIAVTIAISYGARTRRDTPDANVLNLNLATSRQVADLFDVDGVIANRLIAYRDRVGGFDSSDQTLDAPLLSRIEVESVSESASRRSLDPAKATLAQLTSQFALPAPIAQRLVGYREAHPPASANWLKRIPLLSVNETRPRLIRTVVRAPRDVAVAIGVGAFALVVATLVVPLALRSRGHSFDPFLLPLTLLLCGCGTALLFGIKDPLRDRPVAAHQLIGTGIGLVIAIVLATLNIQARGRIRRYQYVWALAVFGLVSALAAFGSGPEGVKLNLFHFQPVEIIKLFLVFFLASTLADRGDLITDAGSRRTPKVLRGLRRSNGRPLIAIGVPRASDFGPVAATYLGALTLFYVIKDLGPGLLLFATFVALLTLTTGRNGWAAIGVIMIVAGGFLGYRWHVGVFPTRVDMWLSPFANAHANGMQLAQGFWGVASGGLEGSGLGLGNPDLIPRSGSDLAFVSWCEETGFIGAWLTLMVYVVIVWRGLRIGLHAANAFDRALAFGLSTLFGLQTLLILAGVTGLFPLTGIALPFLSYGNSAMVADFALIGLLMGISASARRAPDVRPEVMTASRRFGTGYAFLLLGVVGIGRIGWMTSLAADSLAARPIITPDADHVARPHPNPRLVMVARQIGRGSVFDRNGRILATSRPAEIRRATSDPRRAQRLIDSQVRLYPSGALCSDVVGYLDPSVGGPVGIESGYDRALRGYDSTEELLTDYRNKDLPAPFHHERHGHDIYLSLDIDAQRRAAEALNETLEALRSTSDGSLKRCAAFVVLDPKTGDVMADVSLPTYDPNGLNADAMRTLGADPDHVLLNRTVSGRYPPGSTFKIATAAVAIEAGLSDRTFICNRVDPIIRWKAGGVRYVRRNVRDDVGDPAFGTLRLRDAFRVSSNIYFANLAVAIGADRFRSALANGMGFHSVPGPAAFHADLPDIGYGQGRMLVSPLEMARLTASVADEGKLLEPRLVLRTTEPGGAEANETPVAMSGQSMSASTAATLSEMMRDVVENGTARGVFDDVKTTVAGKTGTAQNRVGDGQPHSWFVGFAPADNASVAFACVVENGGYGKRAAAVACRRFLQSR